MPVVHGSYDQPHNRGQWELEIATTLTAKWLLYHHCLPLLRRSGEAAIVNVSSIAAMTGRSGRPPWCSTTATAPPTGRCHRLPRPAGGEVAGGAAPGLPRGCRTGRHGDAPVPGGGAAAGGFPGCRRDGRGTGRFRSASAGRAWLRRRVCRLDTFTAAERARLVKLTGGIKAIR